MHPSERQRVRTGNEDALPAPLWLYQAPAAHKPRRASTAGRLLTSPSKVLTLILLSVAAAHFLLSARSSLTLPYSSSPSSSSSSSSLVSRDE